MKKTSIERVILLSNISRLRQDFDGSNLRFMGSNISVAQWCVCVRGGGFEPYFETCSNRVNPLVCH